MGNRSRIERYPQLIKAIAAAVADGAHPIAAAQKYGAVERTAESWYYVGYKVLTENELHEEEELLRLPGLSPHEVACGQLCFAVEEARGTSQVDAATRAYKETPQWWLERIARGYWRKETKMEFEGIMQHAGEIEVQCPASRETIAAGLVELAALGLPGIDGRMFRQLEGPTEGNGNGDGETDATV